MKRVVLLLTVLIGIHTSATAQYAKWVVEPIYDQIEEFLDYEMAAVKRDGKWGYINKAGEEVISCEYEYVTSFVNGIAIATTSNNKLQAIIYDDGSVIKEFKTQAGTLINELFVDPRYPYFGSDMLLVTNGLMGTFKKKIKYKKWGYLDKNGVLQIPITYFAAMPFSEELAGVADEKMRFSYIDKVGNIVIPYISNVGNPTGVFGFYQGKALVCNDKRFMYIDRLGRKISNLKDIEPSDKYYDINTSVIDCGMDNIVIDSLGRINKIIKSNGGVEFIIDKANERIPLKGDNYFILNGEQVNEDVKWITTSLAVLPSDGKLGVVEAQGTPVVDLNLESDKVESIFGNIEPLNFTLVNNSDISIDNLEIKVDEDVIEPVSIPSTNLTSSLQLVKLTDADIETPQEHIVVTQRGVLLLDETFNITIVDVPSINIIGGSDLIYYSSTNTVSLSVGIENISKYDLENAILLMNNYQTMVTVPASSTVDLTTYFGIIPEDEMIEISVKHEKSPIVIKKGRMDISTQE